MTPPILDLDAPIYETIYNVVTSTGTIVAQYTDRDIATAEAKKRGLRMLKTIKVVEE